MTIYTCRTQVNEVLDPVRSYENNRGGSLTIDPTKIAWNKVEISLR